MPNSPRHGNKLYRLDVIERRPDANYQQSEWRDDEPRFEPLEERPVAIRPNHAGQVMAHRAEGGDKKVNILRAPSPLSDRKQRNQQHRRPDKEQQVPPPIENPQRLWSRRRCHSAAVARRKGDCSRGKCLLRRHRRMIKDRIRRKSKRNAPAVLFF